MPSNSYKTRHNIHMRHGLLGHRDVSTHDFFVRPQRMKKHMFGLHMLRRSYNFAKTGCSFILKWFSLLNDCFSKFGIVCNLRHSEKLCSVTWSAPYNLTTYLHQVYALTWFLDETAVTSGPVVEEEGGSLLR